MTLSPAGLPASSKVKHILAASLLLGFSSAATQVEAQQPP
jgi:hypothetical protein